MKEHSAEYARGRVSGPAIGLIVTASLWGALLLLALAFDVWLLLSGTADNLPQPNGMTKDNQIMIRAAWGLLMLAANVVILLGSVGMKSLRGRSFSWVACVLGVIPCLGPCFVFGIPFGIWGLVVLADPRVRQSFVD